MTAARRRVDCKEPVGHTSAPLRIATAWRVSKMRGALVESMVREDAESGEVCAEVRLEPTSSGTAWNVSVVNAYTPYIGGEPKRLPDGYVWLMPSDAAGVCDYVLIRAGWMLE